MQRLFFLLFFIPSIVYSQSIGIKGGITLSEFYFPPTFSMPFPEITAASNFGIIYSQNFKKFQFTIEPTYNVKGYPYYVLVPHEINGTVINQTKEKWRLQYSFLEMPITIGYIPFNDKFIFGINAGVAPTYLLNGKLVHDRSKDSWSIEYNRRFNLDFVCTLKGGIKITNKFFVVLNVRYGSNVWAFYKQAYPAIHYNYYSAFLELGYKLGKKKKNEL